MTTKKKTDAKKKTTQKTAANAEAQAQLDPEIAEKIAALRSTLRENFGKAVMAMMMVPRYKAQSLGDLQHIILDPMIADRIAIAYADKQDGPLQADMAGFAIWASVSEEVDKKIREQIANGVFPVRLKSDEWNSGKINWLLDVVAGNSTTVTSVIANFRKVAGEGELRLHPLIARFVDPETLEKMGARKSSEAADKA